MHSHFLETHPYGSNYCSNCGTRTVVQVVPEEERERQVCPACGAIHYANPKIVAGTLPIQQGKIWLLRRAIEPRYGAWTFPAGFMEMGETVEQGAQRETREELGIEVELTRLLGVYSFEHSATVHIVYVARAIEDPTGGTETLEYQLFDLEGIPWEDLAFASTHAALRDYLESPETILAGGR